MRLQAMAKYFGSRSMPMNERPSPTAAPLSCNSSGTWRQLIEIRQRDRDACRHHVLRYFDPPDRRYSTPALAPFQASCVGDA